MRGRGRRWRCVIAGLAVGLTWAGGRAAAQMEPIEPELDRLGQYGTQVGAFVLRPRFYAGALFNDNVLASETDEQDDVAFAVNGGLSLVSTWRRHALGIDLAADSLTYQDLDSDDELNYEVEAQGRLDLKRGASLLGSAGVAQLTEGRDNINFPVGGAEPVEFQQVLINGGASVQLARTLVEGAVTWQSFDYEDVALIGGGELDNSGRNFDSIGGTIDASRTFHAGYDAFVRFQYDSREYVESFSAGRDSTGGAATFGVRTEITDLILGEAYIGYTFRDYSGFRSENGFAYGVNLTWTPTSEWRIVVDGSRDIGEASGTDQGGYLSTELELSAFRSVLERLLLGPTIGYRHHDLADERDDEFLIFGFTGRFAVNRFISLDAAYSYVQRDTNVVGRDYEQNRFTIGASLRR